MAFIHLLPSPTALTWMLMRMTLGYPVRAGEMPDRVGHDVVKVMKKRQLRDGIAARNSFLSVNYKENYSMSFGSSDASFAKFCSAFLAIKTANCSSAVRCRIANLASFVRPCFISSAFMDSILERTIS